jgi:arginase family enzyme
MIEDFLRPLNADLFYDNAQYTDHTMGSVVDKYLKKMPHLPDYDIAIVGVEEDRNSAKNVGTADAPDAIRRAFYRLYNHQFGRRIVDLGNITAGATIEDTYYALQTVCYELLSQNICPIILGGSHHLTYAQYMSYEGLDMMTDITIVDARIDIEEHGAEPINSSNFLYDIITQPDGHLFNLSQIGYQTYLVSPEKIDLLDKLFFDTLRVGEVQADINLVEPQIRSSDMISFDISAVRQSESVGNCYVSPNGLYGNEICQIANYAGMSDKISSVGFYEYNPHLDFNNQTANLVAQMMWCFIDGHSNRLNDVPNQSTGKFMRYMTTTTDIDLIFYKSKLSGRWWLEVPITTTKDSTERIHLVACTYNDYLMAANKKALPERWLRAQQKFGV